MSKASDTVIARRSLGLDALRGLAILLMCLSGVVPNGLPNWMYHGYYPRFLPDEDGVWSAVANPWVFRGDWPSFTWVDWVFPLFLFAMGVAFPLAMSRRLERGVSMIRVIGWIFGRGITLALFAVYVHQIIPHQIAKPNGSPTTADWLLGLLGFAILFPIFTRLPDGWPRWSKRMIRVGGVAAAVALVAFINRGPDRAFSWNDKDIIILLLAHMSVAGSLVWLAFRRWWWPRLAVLAGVFVAHHQAMKTPWRWLGETFDGAMPVLQLPKRLLDLTWLNGVLPIALPEGWLNLSGLYDFTWYKFLWIVIPATIVGDVLLQWMKGSDASSPRQKDETSATRRGLLVAIWITTIAAVLVGLRDHASFVLGVPTPWFGIVGGAILMAMGCFLIASRPDASDTGRLLAQLHLWATVWLILGLALEPLEGGIKKGPPSTMSYYLVSLGLSIALLGVFTVWIDVTRRARWASSILVLNGQNPMLAYVAIRNVLGPVVGLALLAPLALDHDSLDGLFFSGLLDTPWERFTWSLAKTLALALFVAALTRGRIIWRT